MRFAFLFAFFLAACANPNYAPPDELTTENPSTLTCQATFQSGHCVSLTWHTKPTEQDFGSFRFKIFRPESPGTLEDLPNVSVVLWMPSMGHGSSPVSVTRQSVGAYLASEVFFSMGGEWEIRFQVKAGQNVQDQASVPFSF